MTFFLLFFLSRSLLNFDEVFRNFRSTKNFGVFCCGRQLLALYKDVVDVDEVTHLLV